MRSWPRCVCRPPRVAVPLLAGGVPAGDAVRGRPPRASRPARRARRGGRAPARGVELLHGVAMEVTVELGRTRMSVRELLALCPGDVLELDRAAGSPADLLVNGRLIARGEVVVVDEDFALRVTEIVAQPPRAEPCWSSLLRVVSSLAVVLGLFWFDRPDRPARQVGGRDRALVRVRSRQALSRGSSLAVVEVGSRVLVLGVSDAGVRLLTELDPGQIAEPELAASPAPALTGLPGSALAGSVLSPVTWSRPGRRQRGAARCRCRPMSERLRVCAVLVAAVGVLLLAAPAASAAPAAHAGPAVRATTTAPAVSRAAATSVVPGRAPVLAQPQGPQGPHGPHGPSGSVTVDLNGLTKKPSTPILMLLGLTLLSLVPAILLTCTSFTKILVVLGLTRNALGLQQIPPNQVLAGLALFLSLFIMSPVLEQHERRRAAALPARHQDPDAGLARRHRAAARTSCSSNTGDKELALLTDVAHRPKPDKPADVVDDHADPGVHPHRAEAGVHHRLHDLHPVPGHRHRRQRGADVARHDDDAAGDGVAAVQAAAVRPRRRLGA